VLLITAADSVTGLDFYDFGLQQPEMSEGRNPDGFSIWEFFDEPTRGESNVTTSSVGKNQPVFPLEYALRQNYPNPFNPATTILFSLPARQRVRLTIFNTLGQRVEHLVDDVYNAGTHVVTWQAKMMPGGVYFYQLKTSSRTVTRKMVLLR
jgi:hypothetical protein